MRFTNIQCVSGEKKIACYTNVFFEVRKKKSWGTFRFHRVPCLWTSSLYMWWYTYPPKREIIRFSSPQPCWGVQADEYVYFPPPHIRRRIAFVHRGCGGDFPASLSSVVSRRVVFVVKASPATLHVRNVVNPFSPSLSGLFSSSLFYFFTLCVFIYTPRDGSYSFYTTTAAGYSLRRRALLRFFSFVRSFVSPVTTSTPQ